MAKKDRKCSVRNPWKPEKMSKTVQEREQQWEGQRRQNRLVRKMPLDQTVELTSDDRKFNKLKEDVRNLADGHNKYVFLIQHVFTIAPVLA